MIDKTVVKAMRVTASDGEKIDAEAAKYGMKVSRYMRERLLHEDGYEIYRAKQDSIKKLESLLGKMGNNINQIARHCNAKKDSDRIALEQVQDNQQTLEKLMRQIVTILMEEKNRGGY